MENSKHENLKKELKSSWGGARVGSGRKPLKAYEMRSAFNVVMDDQWPIIMKEIVSQIKGGDRNLLKWLIEQRIGKSPQYQDDNKPLFLIRMILGRQENGLAMYVQRRWHMLREPR